MKIGEKIKHYRKLNKITQEELAFRTGVSKNTIWNYENDKRKTDHNTLLKIAEALKVDVSDLLGIKEPSKDEILENVENIINDFNTRGYNNLAPLNKEKLINYFRNVLYNIDVIGPNPDDPKDEELQKILESEEFRSYTRYLIYQESTTLNEKEVKNNGS